MLTAEELRKKLEEFPDDIVVIASVMDGAPIKDARLANNWSLGGIRQTVVMIS